MGVVVDFAGYSQKITLHDRVRLCEDRAKHRRTPLPRLKVTPVKLPVSRIRIIEFVAVERCDGGAAKPRDQKEKARKAFEIDGRRNRSPDRFGLGSPPSWFAPVGSISRSQIRFRSGRYLARIAGFLAGCQDGRLFFGKGLAEHAKLMFGKFHLEVAIMSREKIDRYQRSKASQ